MGDLALTAAGELALRGLRLAEMVLEVAEPSSLALRDPVILWEEIVQLAVEMSTPPLDADPEIDGEARTLLGKLVEQQSGKDLEQRQSEPAAEIQGEAVHLRSGCEPGEGGVCPYCGGGRGSAKSSICLWPGHAEGIPAAGEVPPMKSVLGAEAERPPQPPAFSGESDGPS